MPRDPVLSTAYWHDGAYFHDTGQCEYWSAVFNDSGSLAVFFSSESPRNPFPSGSPPYDQSQYFQGMPEQLNRAKEHGAIPHD